MQLINQEQVVQTAQIVLAVLSDETGSTPNRYLDGVVSGKSLLRAIIKGELVICMPEAPSKEPQKKEPKPKAKVKVKPAAPDAKG